MSTFVPTTLLAPGRQTSCSCSTGAALARHVAHQSVVVRASSNEWHNHYRQVESREQHRRQHLGMQRRQQGQGVAHMQQQQQEQQEQQQFCRRPAKPEHQTTHTGQLNWDIMSCQSLADAHSVAVHHQRRLLEMGTLEQSIDAVNVSALATVSAKLWSNSPLSKRDHDHHKLPPPQHNQHQHTLFEHTKHHQSNRRSHQQRTQHTQRPQHMQGAGSSTALYASDPHLLVAQLLRALCDLVAASSLTFRSCQVASVAWALSKLITYEHAPGEEASPSTPAAGEALSVCGQSGRDEELNTLLEQQQTKGHPGSSSFSFPALVPSVLQLIRQLMNEMCSRQAPDKALPVRDVAQVLYAHARVMMQPSPQEAQLMLSCVQRNAQCLAPQDCAMLCYALGRLQLHPHPRVLRRILNCSLPLLRELTPQGLSNTAWGLAVLDAEPLPPTWGTAFLEASSNHMEAFSNQELSLLVWALPRLRIVPSQSWMLALESQVATRLHSLGPQDVSNLMWGMAKLKHRPDPFLVIEVAQEVCHRITCSWAATASSQATTPSPVQGLQASNKHEKDATSSHAPISNQTTTSNSPVQGLQASAVHEPGPSSSSAHGQYASSSEEKSGFTADSQASALAHSLQSRASQPYALDHELRRTLASSAASKESENQGRPGITTAAVAQGDANLTPGLPSDPLFHRPLLFLQPIPKSTIHQTASHTRNLSSSSSSSVSPFIHSGTNTTTPSLKPPPPRPGKPSRTNPAWAHETWAQVMVQQRGVHIPKAQPACVPHVSHLQQPSASSSQGAASETFPLTPLRSTAQPATLLQPPALSQQATSSHSTSPFGQVHSGVMASGGLQTQQHLVHRGCPAEGERHDSKGQPRPTSAAFRGSSHSPPAHTAWGLPFTPTPTLTPTPTPTPTPSHTHTPTHPHGWVGPPLAPSSSLSSSSWDLPVRAKPPHTAVTQGSPMQGPLHGPVSDPHGSGHPALPDPPPSSIGWGPTTHPQVLITLLGSCAIFRTMPPSGVLECFARSLGARLHTCNAADLSSALAALACLRFLPDERWLLRFCAAARLRMPQFSAPQLVALLHGLAGLRVRPDHAWMEWALAEVGQKLSGCKPSHFARLAWTLSTLGYRPSAPWLESFCTASQLALGQLSAHELWMLSCGLAKLGVKARTSSSSEGCSSQNGSSSSSSSPDRVMPFHSSTQDHPNSSQTPPLMGAHLGPVYPGSVLTAEFASGSHTFSASGDSCTASPRHQAAFSVSVWVKGLQHRGRTRAPRFPTYMPQQQQQQQQQQLQQRQRAAYVHTQMQQVNPSTEGSADWDNQLHEMADGQLPLSWVSSLQQAVVSRVHEFEPHRLHAVLVALARLGGTHTLRQQQEHPHHHHYKYRRLGGKQIQLIKWEQRQKRDPFLQGKQLLQEQQQKQHPLQQQQKQSERPQESGGKAGRDAWDAALIDACSIASLMLLAPPMLVRRRETALKCGSQQTRLARGRSRRRG